MVGSDRTVAMAAKQAALKAFGARLQEARSNTSLTQEDVADKLTVSTQTVRNWEAGRTEPSRSYKERLASLYNNPVEWFFGEEDEPQRGSGRVNAPESAAQSEPDALGVIGSLGERLQDFSARFDRLETYIRAQAPVQAIGESRANYDPSNYDTSDRSPVRLMEVASAAGVGAEVYDETPVGLLWFRNDWLLSHSIDPEQSNIISVRGESMEPTLPDGCSILVDRKRREPQEDRIYVMRTEDGLVVKRLGLDEEGRWEIESDNEDWEPMPWTDGTEIIGEVRWSAVTY